MKRIEYPHRVRELSVDIRTSGKHNPRLVEVRKAINSGSLTGDGLLPVEGPKLIKEAEECGLEVHTLFVRSDIAIEDLNTQAAVVILDQPSFRKIQTTEHSQGLVALVRVKPSSLAEVATNARIGPVIVLSRLQDPGNTGTIIRVAESFGAGGCIGLPGTAALYNSKVVRASAGSLFRLPCVWNVEFEIFLSVMHQTGVRIVGTSPHATDGITSWDWRLPTAILIGNEGSGLDDSELQRCDQTLRIPLRKSVESLNSAIAASVILYESAKTRGLP